MRTTITLETDVATRLQAFSRRTGKTFKQAVNDAVREGLSRPKTVRAEPFVQPTHAMGKVKLDLTKALSLAEEFEDQSSIIKLTQGR